MIRKILLITLAITAALAFEPGHEKESYIFSKFQDFLATQNKRYSTFEEYMERFKIFRTNYLKMESFSVEQGKTWSVAMNKFADMTSQEFRRTYLNLDIKVADMIRGQSEALTFSEDTAPAAWDWREQGAVGPVKDQGSCGSCWAFSSVGNLEGLNFIKNKKFVQFSEQQLVDCDKVDSGCNGGLMENAFAYLKKVGGIETSKDYPYFARGGACKFNATKSALKVKGFKFASSKDENEIKEFLFTTGPLSIALNADTLQFYNDGIIDADASECDPEGMNHGVTLVGYGSENGQDFWIVRNSWGKGWGEQGYFRMARGKGTCGINTYVVSADLE